MIRVQPIQADARLRANEPYTFLWLGGHGHSFKGRNNWWKYEISYGQGYGPQTNVIVAIYTSVTAPSQRKPDGKIQIWDSDLGWYGAKGHATKRKR